MIDGIPVGFCECPLETEFISDMVEGMQKKRKNAMSMNFQDIHRRPWVGRTYDSVQQSFNLCQFIPKICWKYINKLFIAQCHFIRSLQHQSLVTDIGATLMSPSSSLRYSQFEPVTGNLVTKLLIKLDRVVVGLATGSLRF